MFYKRPTKSKMYRSDHLFRFALSLTLTLTLGALCVMSDPLLGWAEDRSERSKVDPRESWTGWWVIESAHCRVHYPDELSLLGRRASEACE